ncbi:MAG TPA: DUF5335 domain-containing protein [Rhizomicrobium sp.]|jgi:hypothetical protein
MIRKIEKANWQIFLDRLSKELAGNAVEVEVDGLDLGSHIEAEWVPLVGLTYDHKDDLIEIALEGLDHTVRHPRELYVDENGGKVESLGIVEENTQIVRFREPLLLPSPEH